MKVKFHRPAADSAFFETTMETLPRRDEMIVINGIVYECSSVKHVFLSAGGGFYEYVAEVQVSPV